MSLFSPIHLLPPTSVETATFSLGCFWGPEALFGSKEGVLSTRVGYAGGATVAPTYWQLGDHIETVQLTFNPAVITYSDLLQLFFTSHTPTRAPWKRQYASALFFHSEAQRCAILTALAQEEEKRQQPVRTWVYPYQHFYQAEDRHQKWKLRRQPALWQELQTCYPDFAALNRSTAAARLNGYAGGYGSTEQLEKEIHWLGLSAAGQNLLQQLVKQTRPMGCAS